MTLPRLFSLVPDAPPSSRAAHPSLCFGCKLRRAEHIHHREHKAMGGRRGAARTRSEDSSNKVALCAVCHAASHFEHHFTPDGFSCDRCPFLSDCYYGRVTLGESARECPSIPRW